MKKDFPIFTNNPGLVYLDSAATAQKPTAVIEGVKHYLEHDYATIHRGQYALSYKSEELFWQARSSIAQRMSVEPAEVVFSGNSTDASNMLVDSLCRSGMLNQGDEIFLSELEHHANVLPWQAACEQHGCVIRWIPAKKDGGIDLEWISREYDASRVRVVAVTALSNVTGVVVPVERIDAMLSDETYFVVDASQAIAHIPVYPNQWGADFVYRTGHKLGALPGVGVLRGRLPLLNAMKPSKVGGGAVAGVDKQSYSLLGSPDKFEPGTPNLTGVLSIQLALEYLQQWAICRGAEGTVEGVYGMIEATERPLIDYCIQQFQVLESLGVSLIGTKDPTKKIGLFSFTLPDGTSGSQLGEALGKQGVCIRCGGQCAQPYHATFGYDHGSCRISVWIYSDLDDCRVFFDALTNFLKDTL